MHDQIPQICHCCRWFARKAQTQRGTCHYLPIEVEKHIDNGCSKFEVAVNATPQGPEIMPPWQKRKDEDYYKIVHRDGSEWTTEQLEKYALDNCRRLVYCDIEGCFIDSCGDIYLADECGNFTYIDDDDFIIKWEGI